MISNAEISNRFDVLYNNIMSNQAPGLDEYEKSVFFNKAQLEVLKNKLNPKGNKYAEGFDHTSKRQLDFSALTVDKVYCPALYEFITKPNASFCKNGYAFPILNYTPRVNENNENIVADNHWVFESEDNLKNILSIVNEEVDVITVKEIETTTMVITSYINRSFISYNTNPEEDDVVDVADVTALTALANSTENEVIKDAIQQAIDVALGKTSAEGFFDTENHTIADALDKYIPNADRLVVVPINNVEYDTLMSRPYKYPPKPQAWRMFVDNAAEVVVSPEYIPIRYRMRYIRIPQEVDLSKANTDPNYNKYCCELPDSLVDEVLQRAVELAKNSWEGNIETAKAFGERSE